MLFEMLAGRLPFVASTAGDLIVMHITREPPDLGYWAPSVSTGMTSLVARMLAKLPSERPTMSMVEEQLAQIERKVLAGTAVSTRARRRRGQLLLWGGIAALVLGGSAGLWQGQKRRGQPPGTLPATVARAAPAAAIPAPTPQAVAPVPASAAATTVSWTVRTVPIGAKVVRTPDQVQLGTTPWQQNVPRGEGSSEVSVELPGFSPRQVLLSHQHDTTWELKLEALPQENRPLGDAARGRHGSAERPRDRARPAAAASPTNPTAPAAAAAPSEPALALPAAKEPAAAPPSPALPAAKPQPEQPRDDDIEVPALH